MSIMKNTFMILALGFLIFGVSAFHINVLAETNETNNSTNNNETCIEDWSCTDWTDCVDEQQTRTCTDLNDCGTTENKSSESQDCDIETPDTTDKICCHKFGYGSMMTKVNSRYQMIERESCVTPEGLVGGGREIVDNELCEQYRNTIRTKNRIKANYTNQSECPEDCTCAGSTVKCWIEGGRQMTVYAGKSGNMILQIKGVNMTTKVTLYKDNNTLYGVFKGNKTREIKVLPDQVKEKIRQRIKARLEEYNITLDEDGIYQVQTKKKARLFFLIPVRENVKAQLHSETGQIIKIRNPWWGFLARDLKET